jgi:threonine dehydratase
MNSIGFRGVLQARPRVYRHMKPSPLLHHPLLSDSLGFECYVKHENHNPTGSFKVRGGLNFMAGFAAEQPGRGIISATRGNHGQSLALASRLYGVKCTIVVPRGNNPEKNDAMRANGAELIEYGQDFDEARVHGMQLQHERDLYYVSPGNETALIHGVGTYALEIFESLPEVDSIIAPLGGGSGVCGVLAVAEAIHPRVEVFAVQAEKAPCVYLSWKKGQRVETATASTFADGLATRVTFELPFAYLKDRITEIVLVSEEEMRRAVVTLWQCTHNLAEGAGAAALAAAWKLRERLAGRKVAVVLSGGNMDLGTLRWVLNS